MTARGRQGARRLRLALVLLLLMAPAPGCGGRHGGSGRDLRREPVHALSVAAAGEMLRERGLFDANRNPAGRGVRNRYRIVGGGAVVADDATGRYWQRGGSPGRLTFDRAEAFVDELRRAGVGGFTDWRLPTLDEAMTLSEPGKSPGGLHLDPLFGDDVWWIWTADRESLMGTWVVDFAGGTCFVHLPVGGAAYVRAVRAAQRR